eukprot:4057414-Alexandrium_andersonii.AAC.1
MALARKRATLACASVRAVVPASNSPVAASVSAFIFRCSSSKVRVISASSSSCAAWRSLSSATSPMRSAAALTRAT